MDEWGLIFAMGLAETQVVTIRSVPVVLTLRVEVRSPGYHQQQNNRTASDVHTSLPLSFSWSYQNICVGVDQVGREDERR